MSEIPKYSRKSHLLLEVPMDTSASRKSPSDDRALFYQALVLECSPHPTRVVSKNDYLEFVFAPGGIKYPKKNLIKGIGEGNCHRSRLTIQNALLHKTATQIQRSNANKLTSAIDAKGSVETTP